MAFGSSSRAIAQGASIGLYAGIIFGTYVLVSHHNKRYGYYDDDSSPYRESNDIYGDDYRSDEGGGSEGKTRGGFFDRFEVMQERLHGLGDKKKGSNMPPLYMNLVNFSF